MEIQTQIEIPQEAQELIEQAQRQLVRVQSFSITTVEQYQLAGEELIAIKRRINELEDQRKEITKKIDKAKTAIINLFRPAETQLKEAEELIRKARLDYQQGEERKRQEKETELRRIAEAEQRRRDAVAQRQAEKARARGDEERAQEILDRVPVIPVPMVASEVPKTEGMALRKVWKFRIVDRAALPREYLIPDEKMLGEFARATKGTIPVPGVEFYFEQVEAVKT